MTKKVLVADDEEDLLALAEAILQGDDRYHLLLAKDGEEALAVARREKPDLILLDVMMPKKQGWEVCAELKADPVTRGATVFILTALAQDTDRQRAASVGADGYLTKPIKPSVLRQKVWQALGLT